MEDVFTPKGRIQKPADDLTRSQSNLLGCIAQQCGQRNNGDEVYDKDGDGGNVQVVDDDANRN
jgi:hypothetical protein